MTAPTARSHLSRRRALTGAAAAGVGVPLLAACGDDSGSGETGDAATDPTPSPPDETSQAASPSPTDDAAPSTRRC